MLSILSGTVQLGSERLGGGGGVRIWAILNINVDVYLVKFLFWSHYTLLLCIIFFDCFDGYISFKIAAYADIAVVSINHYRAIASPTVHCCHSFSSLTLSLITSFHQNYSYFSRKLTHYFPPLYSNRLSPLTNTPIVLPSTPLQLFQQHYYFSG